MNVMFLRKLKKLMLCFHIEIFSLVFFSVFPLCHYFLFALLTIIRITKGQRTHNNEAPNINKIIYYNYEVMAKSRCEAILNILKNYFILSYLGVTLSTRNMRDSFCFTQVPLFLQNSNFSVVELGCDMISLCSPFFGIYCQQKMLRS